MKIEILDIHNLFIWYHAINGKRNGKVEPMEKMKLENVQKMQFEGCSFEEILYDYLGINEEPYNLFNYFDDRDFAYELMITYFFAAISKMEFYLATDDPYLSDNATDIIRTNYFILYREGE